VAALSPPLNRNNGYTIGTFFTPQTAGNLRACDSEKRLPPHDTYA
jgi:hypothetical protein